MTEPTKLERMTADEYLAFERAASGKHEYVDGEIFAMSGVTREHNRIAINMLKLLDTHLDGSGCSAYIAEVKVHIEAANSYYYPDVFVECEHKTPANLEENDLSDSPVLVVEVLSRSTRSVDLREKRIAYQKVPSIHEYLIIDQYKKRAILHRRANGEWESFLFAEGSTVRLVSMPCGALEFSIDDIYKGVTLQPPDSTQVREEEPEYEYGFIY